MRFLNRDEVLASAAEGLQDARGDALAILERALDAVEPEMLLARGVRNERGQLLIKGDPFVPGPGSEEDFPYDLRGAGAVRCIAAGKAARPMLRGLAARVEFQEAFAAAPAGPEGASGPEFLTLEAGHPLPDATSCLAGQRALDFARATKEGDVLIVLLSGGASALLEDPLVPLDDLRTLTEQMLASGASIEQMNAIRKKLSGVKGGRLAAAAKGRVLTLVLSDVFEDHAATCGSGPTAPDATTHGDALATLEMLGLAKDAPASVLKLLQEGREGARPETPKPGDPALARVTSIVVGSNLLAAHEAAEFAGELGYHGFSVREALRGPAQRAGWKLARMAEDITLGKAALPRPACVIYGGETTVQLRGAQGRGGRNQEACVAALESLKVEGLVACLATDGIDGPTDAAGGLVDMGSRERAEELGLDLRAALARHDTHPALAKLGDLLRTGTTGTNVADLALVLVP
ncbi:MAG TPA: DUF4147 domain-containing protein [Candidatus Thermoplasmatota archaeon]|nr:DUF4147 domain-containing protein [Candidatus Thermoplasmatota archaeon]